MPWIKEIIVDILVTVVILVAVLTNIQWLGVVVLAYSFLMFLLKGIAALNRSLVEMLKPRKSQAPSWAPYLLYAVNSAALLAYGWWISGVLWLAIWGLSWHTDRKVRGRESPETG